HALVTGRALLAEHESDMEGATRLYTDAAEGWRAFDYLPELAYALLGLGRCLVTLGDSAGAATLAEARELFAGMGYRPALVGQEALLEPVPPSAGGARTNGSA